MPDGPVTEQEQRADLERRVQALETKLQMYSDEHLRLLDTVENARKALIKATNRLLKLLDAIKKASHDDDQ